MTFWAFVDHHYQSLDGLYLATLLAVVWVGATWASNRPSRGDPER